MGNAHRGPLGQSAHALRRKLLVFNDLLDPLSSVDVMKSLGLDSSSEGRLRYAARHGIGGEPFSAAWGDAIRRDVSDRYG